ncbi:diphthine--ammonia ligase-like [Pollicipes pollicipes]|uniref:diphthine--ammonia ligase-like n=1 Tax=Pollicipes pollicipes TaxID=41117 RepID=UPI001884C940|nr:diphthine--ammonia ligase-like [Pollicipes pollicipes]
MRVVALVSGGKDSCYNMMQCVSAGHEIVALANLHPPRQSEDEMDSYMYQTVGHSSIHLYAEAMDLPLYRASIKGAAHASDKEYSPTEGDEVEDLHRLLSKIKDDVNFEAVSVGAILSDYQRVRVENVCSRLGLTSLAYLWRRDQAELLQEMISCQVHAVLVKVAALGLLPDKHLGQSLQEIRPHMELMAERYGLNVCGEGGEYETFTLDCPLFKKRIIVDDQKTVVHSDDAFAPVAYLNFTRTRLEDKDMGDLSQAQRIQGLPLPSVRPALVAETRAAALANGSTECPPDDATIAPEPSVAESEGWFWIGPIDGREGGGQSGLAVALDQLSEVLSAHQLTVRDLALVGMYVARLSQYAALNAEYVRRVGESGPARVCLQAPLPAGVTVRLEAAALRPAAAPRRALHVQSVSHWAPANIGPYSQSVQCGDVLHVAGMIGLDPASMRLVRGGANQARLALRHVRRVIEASVAGADDGWVAQTTCYVTEPALALPASLGCVVVVPALPRAASVEWHVTAHARNAQFQTRQSSLQLDGTTLQVSVRWSAAHRLAATTVLCACPAGAPSPDQLGACLRATLGCLRARAGSAAACRLRLFHRCLAITGLALDAARPKRD